ncbi:putative BLI-3 blue-light-inducible Bli-3 protein [Naviculisporaceae sp. PSN 640]
MAQQFSNTNTGSKPADPYKAANLDTDTPVAEKIEALSNFMSSCKFCMMTTHDATTGMLSSRCMSLAGKENGDIDLLFHTNTESGKTNELKSDSHINISFLNMTGDWASISGVASVITDRALVKKHYSPQLKAWLGDLGDGVHDGSENDPRIGIIRVKMVTAHYAISNANMLNRMAQVAQGAVTGKPAHVNKLREISEAEVKEWRSLH